MDQTKHALRQAYREKRIRLSADELNRLNESLLEQVKQFDMVGIRTIHLFLPIKGNHEPDTFAIADWLLERYPGIRLATTQHGKDMQAMTPVIWDRRAPLKENRWKIPEPEQGVSIPADTIDALFIPLLAFDKNGNRVGYGKGFYDRFLDTCRPDALRIGLSLFDPVDAISDLHTHDIPLSHCITPTGRWAFSGPDTANTVSGT
ncbi:5-formyltetrahydrofolate cyclo-ligase [Parapedobacter lycopersici]|uniref:5-formyltetrahydrofolate cyclo-ligase n=1 Tax=Parapedobacter lycopersici TaxID=1864939 RepID=UPI00214DCE94|nr:5-formyltetrahydrofolate cyclo-ligase [Parapedobacter lycopersici]